MFTLLVFDFYVHLSIRAICFKLFLLTPKPMGQTKAILIQLRKSGFNPALEAKQPELAHAPRMNFTEKLEVLLHQPTVESIGLRECGGGGDHDQRNSDEIGEAADDQAAEMVSLNGFVGGTLDQAHSESADEIDQFLQQSDEGCDFGSFSGLGFD
jgi:hypothetical protein